MSRNKLLVLCLMTSVLCLGLVRRAYSVNLYTVISPKRFEKLHSFPIDIVVQLDQGARPGSFKASLNGIDITSQFEQVKNVVKAVVGPEDGLRIEVITEARRKMNVLKITLEDLKSEEQIDLESFFFVAVDKLVAIGPEGGTVQSLDGDFRVDIPEHALSSTTTIALTKLRDCGSIGSAHQLAPESLYFDRPVAVSMRYRPKDIPVGVVEEDIFLIAEDEFPKKLDEIFVDGTTHVISGTTTNFSKIFMSYYSPSEKNLADIPPAGEFRMPIGDSSDASYACGQDYELPSKQDFGENLALVRRSSYHNFEYPRIVFNEEDIANQWRVVTAYNQNRSVNTASGPSTDDESWYREDRNVFSDGEDWVFVAHRDVRREWPVHAIADGLVIYNDNAGGYWNTAVLAHMLPSGPILSVYSGLFEKSPCRVGTVVHRGNVIGKLWGGGMAHDHLHYAIGKASVIRIDPETGDMKVPAAWFREWKEDTVYEKYYDPTNFIFNIMGKYQWEFNLEGNDEGWIVSKAAGDMSGDVCQVRDGIFSIRSTSADLEITSYPLAIEAESADSVFFKMRSSAQEGQGTVYFATDEQPQYSEDKAVNFEVLGDTEFHEHRIFMADNRKWKGRIVGIRIDLRDTVLDKMRETDFDYIRLGTAYLSRPPDTGQSKCYDNSQEIRCPAPDSPFFGQDGCYAVNTPSYEIRALEGQEFVMDHITGLMWQRHDDGTKRTWREAVDYCENLALAGYSDWRLPTKKELQSTLNYGFSHPAVDTAYFPNSQLADGCYWSATTRAFLALSAWKVCSWDCEVSMCSKYDHNRVRAVRGRPLDFGDFRDNGDGTVTDMTTGLMWQQTEDRAVAWEEALAYCENLDLAGYRDWRLPNIRELSSLVDDNRTEPSIDTVYFPGCRPAVYWSGTSYTAHPSFAWYVAFNDGKVHGSGNKERRHYVRAVRGGE